MKYFLDTEFIEGFHKPLLGKRRHFIDLISIGIVCEDGRTYYAISNEYNFNNADEWVKKNVIVPLYLKAVSGDNRNRYGANTFHKAYGKSVKQISEEIKEFVYLEGQHIVSETTRLKDPLAYIDPQFLGYYCDYDWVLLCSLFGKMIDLPKGFPMYCIDLKQHLDQYMNEVLQSEKDLIIDGINITRGALPEMWARKKVFMDKLKMCKNFPKLNGEHDALADAKWNYALYKFITNDIPRSNAIHK